MNSVLYYSVFETIDFWTIRRKSNSFGFHYVFVAGRSEQGNFAFIFELLLVLFSLQHQQCSNPCKKVRFSYNELRLRTEHRDAQMLFISAVGVTYGPSTAFVRRIS